MKPDYPHNLYGKDQFGDVDYFYGSRKVKDFSATANHDFQEILSFVRKDENGGQQFRESLESLTEIMAKEMPIEKPLIVAIPRGGVPMGNGFHKHFPDAPCILTNDGKLKDLSRPLLPENFPANQNIDHLVLVDTVIGTGQTLIKTIEKIKSVSRIRFVHVVSAVASDYGIKKILESQPFGLRICTAAIETKHQWVIQDNKPVLFVADIGDAGDLVSR